MGIQRSRGRRDNQLKSSRTWTVVPRDQPLDETIEYPEFHIGLSGAVEYSESGMVSIAVNRSTQSCQVEAQY